MSTSAFIDKLYAELNSTSPLGNIFFSPYSISMSLAMLAFGSKGETLHQIIASNKLMSPKLTSETASVEVMVSNGLFLESSFKIKRDYINLILSQQSRFGFNIQNLKYLTENDRKESATIINRVVAEQTRDKISQAITPESLDEFTRLVITSVIYFEAKWDRKFYRLNTKLQDFNNSDGTKTPVAMMHQSKYKYVGCDESLNMKCVGIPYSGYEYFMWVFLPNVGSELDTGLTVNKMQAMIDSSEEKFTNLGLPKFKIDCEKPLKDTFMALGMTEMFDIQKADFKTISDEPELHVSDLFHKAFLEVNEDGTVAGALTRKIFIKYDKIITDGFGKNNTLVFINETYLI